MTVRDIIRKRNGKTHAWRIEHTLDGASCLYHYATCMLVWIDKLDGSSEILCHDLGHGSVSDQRGMNIAFRELGCTWYYSRARGAHIIDLAEIPFD
jgi:hypothetical protein